MFVFVVPLPEKVLIFLTLLTAHTPQLPPAPQFLHLLQFEQAVHGL